MKPTIVIFSKRPITLFIYSAMVTYLDEGTIIYISVICKEVIKLIPIYNIS